jgi:putative endonuclease
MTGSGEYGESLAQAYLKEQGFRILATNYRFHHGELDIVAEEGEILVFCEVKTRSNAEFGPPECAISEQKQRQLRRLALAYLTVQHINDRPCRFDVVAIRIDRGTPEINHIRDAFR